MVDIVLKLEGRTATLDLSSVDLEPEYIEERLAQVLPLVRNLLDADVARVSLDDEDLRRRLQAIAAQMMVVEAAIWSVTLQAELLGAIVRGEESIRDHGFPEFQEE